LDLSLGTLVVAGFISLIGLAILMYGRKEMRVPHLVAGLILIVFPYFVGNIWIQIAIAAAVVAGLALVSRLGY
jgi:hypothetical protein